MEDNVEQGLRNFNNRLTEASEFELIREDDSSGFTNKLNFMSDSEHGSVEFFTRENDSYFYIAGYSFLDGIVAKIHKDKIDTLVKHLVKLKN